MLLQQIADALDLSLMTPSISLDRPVVSGYAADLLSCAMAAAKAGTLWITLQAHPNVCLLYTSPSPRDRTRSRMPSSA